MLSKVLENLGLNAKEAKVYLAALEIGSNPVSKIASKAKINRVTTYDIIEKLTKKGLISSFTRAKVKYFTATEPEIVITDFQRKVGELKEILPDLQRLTGETVHPRVRYFEGLEGIRHIYEDTLTSKTEILNYGDSEEIRKHWPNYDQDYVAKRAEKKIFLRGITLDDDYGRKVVEGNTDFNREIRLIPKEKFNFSNEICIYDDKVAIISFKDELIGMIIESPEIANTQRAIFGMVWEFSNNQFLKVSAETDTGKKEVSKNETSAVSTERIHSPLNGLKVSDILGKSNPALKENTSAQTSSAKANPPAASEAADVKEAIAKPESAETADVKEANPIPESATPDAIETSSTETALQTEENRATPATPSPAEIKTEEQTDNSDGTFAEEIPEPAEAAPFGNREQAQLF